MDRRMELEERRATGLPLVALSTIRLGLTDHERYVRAIDASMIEIGNDDGCRLYWIAGAEGPGMGFNAVAVEWGLTDDWDDPLGVFSVLIRAEAGEGGIHTLAYGDKGRCFLPNVMRHAKILEALRELEVQHCRSPLFAIETPIERSEA